MDVTDESNSNSEYCSNNATGLWNRYKQFVARNTTGIRNGGSGIANWRDMLFTNFITYLLPTCLIALIPGVVISFQQDYVFIGVSDIVALLAIVIISLNPRIGLAFRKLFVIGILYVLAIILLVLLSLTGPGTIYLLALSILVTVFFPRKYAYWSVLVSFFICCCCAFIIHLNLFGSPLAKDYVVGVWIAVSSNIIFLNWVLVMLICNAIEGLEQTIVKEFLLKEELQKRAAEQKHQSILLEESENQYKILFFQNPAPMWVLDVVSLRLLQVNEAAIHSYGYTNDEFLSLNIMDIKLEEDRATLKDDIQTTIDTGVPLTVITQHRRKNKEQFYAEVILNAILFKGNMATLVIARDISEQVAHARAVQMQNDKLREIAHIQSHHVRAPLARILGFINLIHEDASEKTDPQLLQYLNESALELDEVIREINRNTENVVC